MIIFGITLNPTNRSLSNYPVYVRNHLFNTNPTFDYGAFRQLEIYVTQTNWTVTNFAHVFLESGIYVFRDSQQAGQELIINVLANGLLCDVSRIEPATTVSLGLLGISKQSVTNLTPDWVLIAVLLALFGLCVIVLVIAVIVWRPRDAGIFPMRYWMPRYRSLGEPYVPPQKEISTFTSHDKREGLGLIRERGEAEGAEADLLKDDQLLEDFNVRTLYDKLEDQNLHLSSQLNQHQDSLRGFYEKISNQTEGLKKMLNKLDVSKLEAAELARSAADPSTVINTTVKMDGLHRDIKLAGGQSLREKELLLSLEALIGKLNSGKITVSDEVINDARNRLKGIEDKDLAKKVKSDNLKGSQRSDDWKVHGQADLIRAQESDKIDLERELISGEREAITNLLITHDSQREKLLNDLNNKLAFKSQGELSEKEMNSLLAEHERELENALGALSKERMRQMNELKEQLAAKRRERADQLNKTHSDQCREAGIPSPSVGDAEGDKDDLSLMEKQLEAALLHEGTEACREDENVIKNIRKEEEAKISKTFDGELDTMVANGLISSEVRDQLKKQLLEQENDLNSRMEKKREMQFKAMRDRMAERKKRRMKTLRNQQEQEKELADEYTSDMEERHNAEIGALEAELNAEEALVERGMNEALETEHQEALKELHFEVINDLTDKHGVDPVAQQELLDRFRRDMDNFDHINGVRKQQQSQNLMAKLAARRARRAADVQKMAERRLKKDSKESEEKRLEELEKFQEEQNAAGREELDGLDVPDVVLMDNYEIQALSREHERLLADTDVQQAADVEKLMVDLDKKDATDVAMLERKLKEEKDRLMREASAKHEAEARARTDLSEEQIQQLMAAHQQEMGDLEKNLESQQNRQRAALNEKIAARRKRKTNGLRQRQENEKETEKMEQRIEMTQVKAKTTKEAERDAIIEGIERNGAAASELVIQKVLEKRHAQELKDLEEEYALKKKLLIDDALKTIKDQFQSERDAMLTRHDSEISKLENERLSSEEFLRRKEELMKEHRNQLRTLDSNHKRDCSEITSSTSAQWKLDYAQAKLKLKEQHYQEFADALRELAPSASQQQTAEQAEESAKRLEETKQRLEQDRLEAEMRLAKERSAFDEEEQRRVALAMAEFEKELEEEMEQDKTKAEKTLSTLAKRKDKMLKDKKEKIREEIERAAAAGASEEEQKKIMEQYEKDVENLTNNMDRERLRMKAQLEERLKKKRKEKMAEKKNELQQGVELSQKEIEAKQKSQMQKVQEKQVEKMQQAAAAMEQEERSRRAAEEARTIIAPKKEFEVSQNNAAVAPPSSLPSFDEYTAPIEVDSGVAMMPYISAPAVGEKDIHDMLNSSPLYQTLQEVKRALDDEKTSENLTGSSSKFVGPDVDSIDVDLIPFPLADLNTRELVAYKFGTFILGLLKTRRPSHPPVNLLVAEKVPAQPSLKGNAFRGSFCFDEGNGILFVKRARLTGDSIGRFSLLLVHAMAHIATGALDNDDSTAFVQEFYQCLAVLSDDLFFARYKNEPNKIGQASDGAEKTSLSQDLLSIRLPDRDVSTPAADSLRHKGLNERIDKYAQSVVSSMVREELGRIESKVSQAKSSGTCDEIDSKLATLLPQTPSTSQSTRSRPDTRASQQNSKGEQDLMNSEFVSLAREAGQIQEQLASGNQSNDVALRNRLNNVQVRISDLQKRIRSDR